MEYIQMNAEQLGNYMLQVENDVEINFADTWDEVLDDTDAFYETLGGWHGFKKIEAMDANIVIMSWMGGGYCVAAWDIEDDFLISNIESYFQKVGIGRNGTVMVEASDEVR